MPALSPSELARYSRHLRLEEVGEAGQERLKAARVLVVGAGGLGSPAALYLAAAGVGTLGIADFDRVEAHNLQRQLLHSDASIGEPKVASAVRRLRETNPFITVVGHEGPVTAANAVALFREYDLIVDGTDTFATRYLNNDAAVIARRPLVHGSIYKFEGSVAVFAPHRGRACYRCLFPEPPAPGAVPNCGEAGVLGALCGVIGSLQAMEAIKWIVGLTAPGPTQMLTYDGLAAQFRSFTIPREPDCPGCGPRARATLDASAYALACAPALPSPMSASPDDCPLEISVEETARLLRESASDVFLLDVREPYEVEICRIEGAALIPMRQIPAALETLPAERHVLVHCHHGGRSLRVTQFLRQHGFPRVSNVAGGIEAWAERIDPRLRRY
jgi:sulfur-carrier protein adenylyltransferase/sulfurtransferase